MGNYLSEGVGNYVSVRPLQVGNYMSADTNQDPATPQHRYSPVHLRTLLSLLKLTHCRPSPCAQAFPDSEYYDGSAPPAPSAGVAPIPTPAPPAERKMWNGHR
jgi:hypothetical protein